MKKLKAEGGKESEPEEDNLDDIGKPNGAQSSLLIC